MKCTDSQDATCTECEEDYVLLPDNTCINPCSGNYYIDNDGDCHQCARKYDADCQVCNSERCTRCQANKFLIENSPGSWNCIDECPIGYFENPNPNPTCFPCQVNFCESCEFVTMDGTTCRKCMKKDANGADVPPADMYLYHNTEAETYSCLENCPSGYTEVIRSDNGIYEC